MVDEDHVFIAIQPVGVSTNVAMPVRAGPRLMPTEGHLPMNWVSRSHSSLMVTG